MAKSAHDDVLDAGWNLIKANCDKMVACSAQPTSYAEANATYALADTAMASGDFTIGNGDVSGRKMTVGQKSAVAIDESGTASHVALLDSANSKLLYVTTCTNQALTKGGTVTFPAWDAEMADPV